MKKLINLFAFILLFANTSNAFEINKDLQLIPTIALNSQKMNYNYGVHANRNQPSVFGEVSLKSSAGPFATINYAYDKPDQADAGNGTYDYERCGIIGFSRSFGKLTPSISFEDCRVELRTDGSTGTYYLGLSGEATKELTLFATYWKDDNKGIAGIVAGNWWADYGYQAGLSYAHKLATASFTYGYTHNFSKYYKPSLSKEIAGINFNLTYLNTDITGNTNYVSNNFKKHHDRDHVILSISKSF